MNGMKQVHSARLKLRTTFLVAAIALVALSNPASAGPQGFIEEEIPVGYFYGSFDQSPNVVLMVGGSAEDFCENNPMDPFNAEPGTTTQRVFLRSDGSVDIKGNDKNQPIYLYNIDSNEGAPPWIEDVCAGLLTPDLLASGTADLKVRVTVVSEGNLDVFNSVNGKATGPDGTQYKVRASADVAIVDGMPVGDPEDFISFDLKEIGR